uniref:Uncharacterized protein n=1 Tax=Arundo donax TaxID=35708 RepID=A0A0A9AM27_ARUDO
MFLSFGPQTPVVQHSCAISSLEQRMYSLLWQTEKL